MKWFYMHTLNGKPARYVESKQIVYVGGSLGGRNSKIKHLATSVTQIRKEQSLSRDWRLQRGYQDDPKVYGYVRIAQQLL